MSNTRNNSNCKSMSNDEFADNVFRICKFGFSLLGEIFQGVFEFRMPLVITAIATFLVGWGLNSGWDYYLFFKGGSLDFLYPRKEALYGLYFNFWLCFPAIIWGTIRVVTKRNRDEEVDTVFKASGVTNRIGQAPKHLETYRRDDGTSVMRVSAKGISVDDLKKSKSQLEQSLRAHVDGIEANLSKGTIDIRYSQSGITEKYEIAERDLDILRVSEFIVGKKLGELVRAHLTDVPHLLIAGETGGGKSTFLRQLITGLYLNDLKAQFTLIDLKAGLEFYLFKNISRINVITDLDRAIVAIGNLESEIGKRFRLLEDKQCRDLDSYRDSKGQSLPRHIIVIDEVAELFLSGSSSSSELTKARATLNRIARQGRALGVHLIVATQRPDSRSLDPQIKANLSGVLCFAMVNDASSVSVLGNGQATDIPNIKGRAIWKVGSDMAQVQTPYLDESIARDLLKPYKVKVSTQIERFNRPETSDRFEPM